VKLAAVLQRSAQRSPGAPNLSQSETLREGRETRMPLDSSRSLVLLEAVPREPAHGAEPPLAGFIAQLVACEARLGGFCRTRRVPATEARSRYDEEPPGAARPRHVERLV
jgi:hypothetical protein